MSFKTVTKANNEIVGILPGLLSDIVKPEDIDNVVRENSIQTLTNKTLESPTIQLPIIESPTINDLCTTLTGTAPNIKNGTHLWVLTDNSTPVDTLINGQSCTLIITPGSYLITWPTSSIVGTWPTSLATGVNVIVLFKVGDILFRAYSGAVE